MGFQHEVPENPQGSSYLSAERKSDAFLCDLGGRGRDVNEI